MIEAEIVPKVAQAGTKMFRKSDAMGVVRKLIQRGHEAAHEAGERLDPEFFRIRQKQVAVLYEALAMMADLPVFYNAVATQVESEQ